MTSRKDSVIDPPHTGGGRHLDVDLQEQMGSLKLNALSRNEAENCKSESGSAEDTLTEKSRSVLVEKSESSSILVSSSESSPLLERTAQQLVIETFKHLGSPRSTPPQGEETLTSTGPVLTHPNEVPPPVGGGGPEVHFEGIESKLLGYLSRADGVKMCAAWFTSPKIAEQLSLMGDVGLIIGSTEKITPGHPEYRADWVHTLLTDLPGMVFVYGGASGKRLMHNKFMVLFREDRAYAVITGSYNYTYSAGENWENIVYIESEELGRKYFAEYTRILQHCQPLNRYLRR